MSHNNSLGEFVPPPRANHGRVVFPMALLAIALLLFLTSSTLAVVRALDGRGDGPSDDGSAGPTLDPDADLLQTIDRLKRFVEKERGLAFKEEIDVTLLADSAFRKRLVEGAKEDLDEMEVQVHEEIFKALKLIEEDVDLQSEEEELYGAAAAGFYDSKTDELVIRGEGVTPYRQVVLVHEITHALQDQHFNLYRPELEERADETILGFEAVLEGDAGRIENQFKNTALSAEERDEAEREERELFEPPDVPDLLINLLSFPYVVGPSFVQAIVDAGGQPMLDEAFRTPPATSEVLIHPERYVAKEAAKQVPPPPAEGEVINEGVFGEWALILLLSESLSQEEFLRAADGWGGDYYVAYRKGSDVCVRADFVMDSNRDQTELTRALRSWADKHGAATVSGTSPTRVTACS